MKFLQETIDTTTLLQGIPRVLKFALVGSALIDPETAADLDFLVLAEESKPKVYVHNPDMLATCDDIVNPGFLTDARWLFPEWSVCSGKYDDQTDKWGSLRLGNVNLIVTTDPGWYERGLKANEVCVALKLKDKGDRIVAYRVIRDGYNAEQANARRDGSR